MKSLIIFLFSAVLLHAATADEVIKQMEDNLQGVDAYNKLTMEIKTSRQTRTMKMEAWSKGKEKSFIRINYPKKDKGITFLKLDKQMWQYVPKIEKTIKIPASMMMQSWMGSGFSNDDMVQESSMSKDYHKKILKEDSKEYTIELMPKEDAAVVWGKIIMVVEKKTIVASRLDYYDEDEILERTLFYKDVKKVGKRNFPHRWVMQPQIEDERENVTTVIIDEINFNPKIKDSLFTKRALKRFSR